MNNNNNQNYDTIDTILKTPLNAIISPLFAKILEFLRSKLTNSEITVEIGDAIQTISEAIDRTLNSFCANSIEELQIYALIVAKLCGFRRVVIKQKSFDLFGEFFHREEVKNSLISQVQVLLDRVIYSIDFDKQCVLIKECAQNRKERLELVIGFIDYLARDRKFDDALKICERLLKLKRNILENFDYGRVIYITGLLYHKGLRDHEKAKKYLTDALNIFECSQIVSDNRKHLRNIAMTEQSLGTVLVANKLFKKALEHFKRAKNANKTLLDLSHYCQHRVHYIDLCTDYAHVMLGIAYCNVMLENYSVANQFVSTLLGLTDVNFAKIKKFYPILISVEKLLIRKGFTVDWMGKCINCQPYEFDYDWKDQKCRIAARYIHNGEPVKGVKLFLDYNNEFEKRYHYPYNIYAAYGIFCGLLDIEDNTNECKTDINILEEIPEIDVFEWLIETLPYFQKMKTPPNFKIIRTKSLNKQVIQLPAPLTETKLFNNLRYKINSEKDLCRGICVIIQNIEFVDEREWRTGSIIDAFGLIWNFRAFNYQVIVLNDKSNSVILKRLKEIASGKRLARHDSFVCIALSHGDNGIIYSLHEQVVYTHEILNLFSDSNCPHLANKPKIFIFNCCRGAKTYDCDALVTEIQSVNTNQNSVNTELAMFDWHDMFVWYSTIEGFVSYRHCKGSVFIDNLNKVLEEYFDNNLMDLAKKVERSLNSELSGKGYKQITCIETYGWRKDFYFYSEFLLS